MPHLLRVLGTRARSCVLGWAGIGALALTLPAGAAQVDIPGPPGSVSFGTTVAVLSNGNFVVIDPNGPVSAIGAVYLYSPSGTLISTLTGSSTNDHIGSDGVVVVGGGNFVVMSTQWNNAGVSGVGAVTWVNGTTGLSGVVSVNNSLVGTTKGDAVGSDGVIALSNGNYVVASSGWNNGVASSSFGAVTWGNGSSGITGSVSASNSLIGTTAGDLVGNFGLIGGVTALSNGNYVVASPNWNNGVAGSAVGAASWGNGSSGVTGPVSASNSLIGTTTGDSVGNSVTALSNGNYVVASPTWNNGVASSNVGAVTWGNGSSGVTGPVLASNSLIGTTTGDDVGRSGVTALSNGNYLVFSPFWNNGVAGAKFGAVTWGNGSSGITGPVSASNSLIGTTPGDSVGSSLVSPLKNGNYVVASAAWNNGVASSSVGAATWGDGSTGITGPVSASNSLIGTTNGDNVGLGGVTALSNGNYVVRSAYWRNGVAGSTFGAATWGNGTSGITGPVSASNSLIGTTNGDNVGIYGVTALRNGNYVVGSPDWNNGVPASKFGAATWGNGSSGITGAVSAANSLIGTTAGDFVSSIAGFGGVRALRDGNYVVASGSWSGSLGAMTLASGAFRLKGTIQTWNSVLGTTAAGGDSLTHAYDPARKQLMVGRPADNMVSLFTMDQIFADDFAP